MKPLMNRSRREKLAHFGLRPADVTPQMKKLAVLNHNPHGLRISKDGCWYPGYWDNGLLFEPLQVWMRQLTIAFPRLRSFVDLGSGDGFMVYIAAASGLQATGIEKDPACFRASLQSGKMLESIGLGRIVQRCRFVFGDAFDRSLLDFSQFDLFYVYPSVGGMQRAVDLYAAEGSRDSLLLVRDNRELEAVDGSAYYVDPDFFGFYLVAKQKPAP